MRRYRPDIDGLRALAVLPVLFFHAGVLGMDGGYVGVDVFFVISGYLITGIIQGEVVRSEFSIVRFYERRVRRLLPALFAVVLVTSLVAYRLCLPREFKEFGQSVAAVALFSSNILFFRQAGYFDTAAETKPLLHTWSLAVEEQFYVFFPLLLIWVHRRLGNRAVPVVAGLSILSFVANVAMVGSHQSATFYLLPFRAWELWIGSLLALNAVPPIRSKLGAHLLGGAGLAMVVLAVATFSAETPFPGWAALLPCLGAASILHAGASGGGVAHRVLSTSPIVFIGKISYSLYLWHWPVVVFTHYTAPDGELDAAGTAFVVVVSIVLGALSWRFVEQPFRSARTGPSRRAMFLAAAGATAVWLGFGVLLHVTRGLPSRLPEDTLRFAQAANDFSPAPNQCPPWAEAPELCLLGAPGGAPSFLMWGDSHAGILVHGVEELARERGRTGLFTSRAGCPPLFGVAKDENTSDEAQDARCAPHNARVLEVLRTHPEIERVLLVGRWAYYAAGEGYGPEARNTVDLWFTDSGEGRGREHNRAVFERALRQSLSTLLDLGKEVFVLQQVPELSGYESTSLARALILQGEGPREGFEDLVHVSRADVDTRQRSFAEVLSGFADEPRLHVLPTRAAFCQGGRCDALEDGVPRYFDNNHVTTATARSLRPVFEPIFQ